MEDMDIDSRTSPKQAQHIQWDEETIAEHDKDRGTRQKILEPPTPYNYLNSDTESEKGDSRKDKDIIHSWEELNAKLHYEEHQQQRDDEKRVVIGEAIEHDITPQNEVVEGEGEPHSQFLKHRAAHYNEFKVLKALKEKGMLEEEE